MTGELNIAVEELYTTFSIYPLNPTMEGCPCCVSHGDKSLLHSKELRELQEEDLSKYAFKAMTTWGSVDDFKHYLPRIFELLSLPDFMVDSFMVLDKLEYGKWRTWPANEQAAVERFLLALWTDIVQNKCSFSRDGFLEIYGLLGNMDELLARWPIRFSDCSFSNFVEFVYYNYHDLTGKKANFRNLDNICVGKIMQWISDNRHVLEEGFFHFEQSDKEFAEKISVTLDMIEKINCHR